MGAMPCACGHFGHRGAVLYLLDRRQLIEFSSLQIGLAIGTACLFTILGFVLLIGLTRDDGED
ncbi:MAG: hypothetical protein QF378_05260 [Candidatus Poseidoniia archaeon]|nr:hypothetical protein [Candidatus Poseidoniia archaeon]MDP7607917.1 hypothetical protein [Candidatus Poseidoniia archaeon]